MISGIRGNRLLFILIAVVWSGLIRTIPGFSSNNVPNLEQFSINEGLSSSSISTLFEDSRGYLWVGTRDGLNRYDGYNFRSYNFIPLDSFSITGNFIQSILKTPDGNIWVGTKDNGISIWDRATDHFSSLNVRLKEDKNLGITKYLAWELMGVTYGQ